jgi:hypothetical protein
MDGSPKLTLSLLEQHWCGPEPEMDPSQGGRLRVVINGVAVMDGESRDTGVARSALALSRTLLSDHTAESPVAEQLVLHDCGLATHIGGCGIGANWWVRHDRDSVRIEGVVRFDTTFDPRKSGPSERADGVFFPEADCVIPFDDYASEIMRLGDSVLAYAAGAVKDFADDFERSEWLGWQSELRGNLVGFKARADQNES